MGSESSEHASYYHISRSPFQEIFLQFRREQRSQEQSPEGSRAIATGGGRWLRAQGKRLQRLSSTFCWLWEPSSGCLQRESRNASGGEAPQTSSRPTMGRDTCSSPVRSNPCPSCLWVLRVLLPLPPSRREAAGGPTAAPQTRWAYSGTHHSSLPLAWNKGSKPQAETHTGNSCPKVVKVSHKIAIR